MSEVRPTIISVCTMCGDEIGSPESALRCPGHVLYQRLSRCVADGHPTLTVKAVPCLAVCERPVTVAFQAVGAWGYVIAGVDANCDVDGVIAAARAIASSAQGIPAMADRPRFFRDGVVCRVPPVP
ncbi:MAG: DUF1636 family protein [Hyphomicrobiaceae bacterium]